ncbi:MAG: ribbon-helix-helix domain-containing protein [bacterium]|nr:ribbon-helix-helix domain-containing protein [bacterium]
MRSIINISLPKALDAAVDKEVKRGKYASKSEFFRTVLKRWLEEQKVIAEILESRAEIRAGKGILLRSLADLE